MLPNTISQDRAKNWSSLHDAAANGDEEMLKTLLAGIADATIKELKFGNTALHEAASRGYSRSVKVLCASNVSKSHGLNDKRRNEAHSEARGVVRASILSIQNHAGFTALHLAAQNGHNQSCREILWAGANPDIENYYGDTSLHTACRYGHAGAARILISAFCDVNKRNLNGDTPLHITSAMGRHKLSRILLEADCDTTTRNAQGETPRDIATRKGFTKILDILDNPHRIRNRHTKPVASDEKTTKAAVSHPKTLLDQNEVSWSPYGCHYFPDPRSFPSPKLETLPKEPLKRGEQYYLDLAGHIRKGPIGIGNICYCGPFFKHIEDKINSNRRQLRKYVHNAKEHLDDKVQALAARTNHQIEKLTRTMIADRVLCENRRIYLENYLKRSDPLRLTTDITSRRKQTQDVLNGTLKRCRSLEFLDKGDALGRRLSNSRSFDLLEQKTDDENPCRCGVECVTQASESNNLNDEVNDEFYDVSKRLGNLLAKTSTFLKDPESNQLNPKQVENMENVHKSSIEGDQQVESKKIYLNNSTDVLQKGRDGDYSSKLHLGNIKVLQSRTNLTNEILPTSASILSNGMGPGNIESGEFNSAARNTKKADIEYLYDIQRRGNVIKNVISALRKSHQKIDLAVDVTTHNDTEHTQEDKLGYKDEKSLINGNGLFQLARNDAHKATSLEEIGVPVFAKSKDTINISECAKRYQQTQRASQKEYKRLAPAKLVERDGSGKILLGPEELLIEASCGIKAGMCNYESLYSGSQSSDNGQIKTYVIDQQVGLTLDQCHEVKQSLTSNSTSSHSIKLDDVSEQLQNNYWPERIIPKDAYFHDIKRKGTYLVGGSNIFNSDWKQNGDGLQNKIDEKSKNPQLVNSQYVNHAKLPTTVSSIATVKCFNKKPSQITDVSYHRNTNYAQKEQITVRSQYDISQNSLNQHFTDVHTNEYNTSAENKEHKNITSNPSSFTPNQEPSYGYGDEQGMLKVQPKLPVSVFYASNVSSLV